MLSENEVQEALRDFVCVEWLYDGLGGSVIQWTFEHGNTNEDPSVLAWVLDPEGRELSSGKGSIGSPGTMIKWLEEQSAASFPLVDPADFTELTREAASIVKKKKIGETLARLRELSVGGEGVSAVAQQEAAAMLAKMLPYAQWQLDRAAELRSEAPAAALALYKGIAVEFKGDEIGEQARSIHDNLKEDPAFKAELKAFAMLEQVEGIAAEFRPCKGTRKLEPESCADCRTKNKALLQKAAALLVAIERKYPGTSAAQKAAERLAAWQLR